VTINPIFVTHVYFLSSSRLKYYLFSRISGLAIVHYYSLNKKFIYQNLFLANVEFSGTFIHMNNMKSVFVAALKAFYFTFNIL